MLIAGGLGKGGAEKQLVYMLRALRQMDVELRVLTLTTGEFHERSLQSLGIHPVSLGSTKPAARVSRILQEARAFRPHFIQATHFFASIYAGVAGRLSGVPSIGAIRGDLHHDLAGIGKGGRWLLRFPSVFLANSYNAQANALLLGLPPSRVYVLQNVIDLQDFDRRLAAYPPRLLNPGRIHAITVARLQPVKRLERFLHGLALARQQAPELEGLIVGSGPEERRLREQAQSLGLQPDQPNGGVHFLGERDDIPQLLSQSQIFVLTSEREGFPNVLLEAMSASLPIVTTPAGEASTLVQDGKNGFLSAFDDHEALAGRLLELARSPALRGKMGRNGRQIAEERFSYSSLAGNLVNIYRSIARETKNQAALFAINNNGTRSQGVNFVIKNHNIPSNESR